MYQQAVATAPNKAHLHMNLGAILHLQVIIEQRAGAFNDTYCSSLPSLFSRPLSLRTRTAHAHTLHTHITFCIQNSTLKKKNEHAMQVISVSGDGDSLSIR